MNIVVSDIWGMTSYLQNLICEIGSETIIHDSYDGQLMSFKNEQQAYCYFMEHSGIDSYSKSLNELLEQIKMPVNLIGFSSGASAIWNITDRIHENNIQTAICFYGGQIRHTLNKTPKFKTIHIMPRKESHFDLPTVIDKLAAKPNTEIIQTEYLHGFMNQCSPNFSSKGYQEYLTFLKGRLRTKSQAPYI
ncbi:hypothetical protein D5018_11185 [Parashewanella curva]|uniref:Uncharacterized protein n=1 Tax=Parashewanella curva TaxID=2338552 RepID=A0A3L8PW08_9GAMM|nr:dienelactone hydrolase family protein [Parashewanella curva]RLV59605.1 hypothetical protein D5018_11185 [Parashewanella curva]